MSELERWEARFSAPGYHFGTEPNAFLKSKAHLLKPGQQALSIAVGGGPHMVATSLASQTFGRCGRSWCHGRGSK